MSRPLLLDLFCGAGGAAMGYHRAGFDVIGVDKNPDQLRQYPFPCVRGDALNPPINFATVDAVHASPPCQAYSVMTPDQSKHPQLVEPTRDLLNAIGAPWVMENVPGSPVRGDFMLCGTMFGLSTSTGLTLNRHRYFEIGYWRADALGPQCAHQPGKTISVSGNGTPTGNRQTLGRNVTFDEWREVMGIDWTNRYGVAQAIPPAYTEFIGRQLIQQLGEVAA